MRLVCTQLRLASHSLPRVGRTSTLIWLAIAAISRSSCFRSHTYQSRVQELPNQPRLPKYQLWIQYQLQYQLQRRIQQSHRMPQLTLPQGLKTTQLRQTVPITLPFHQTQQIQLHHRSWIAILLKTRHRRRLILLRTIPSWLIVLQMLTKQARRAVLPQK